MISSFQKVGLSANAQPENRQLAIDLTEVILRWEVQRVRDVEIYNSNDTGPYLEQKQQLDSLLTKHPDMLKSFDKNVADCLLNFFIRTACPINDPMQQQQQQQQQAQSSQQQMHTSQSEALSKRCFYLFQMAISNETCPYADIKYDYLDKILTSLETTTSATANNASLPQPNYSSICTCIEMITFLVDSSCGSKVKIQNIFRNVQRGLAACLMSNNSRVIKIISVLIQKIMAIIPVENFNNNPRRIIT
jgi:transformation/transcription domain-associated protein